MLLFCSVGTLSGALCRPFCGRLVRIINDSFSHLKRDMGTDIELCHLSLPKKKGASVSVPLWLICQTLLQRSLSHVTQLRRICGDCGEFSALISRRLPSSWKERRHKEPPPSLPSSYLSPSYYHTFHDSSLHLQFSYCQNISPRFVSTLGSSPFVTHPSVPGERT